MGSGFLKIAAQYNIPVQVLCNIKQEKGNTKMGKFSLFGKIKGINRDSMIEQVVMPVDSALEVELTDEELETIRGGYGHHGHWHHRWHHRWHREGDEDHFDFGDD
jgi:hypothetical protein